MSETTEEFAEILGKHLGGTWCVSLEGTMPIIPSGVSDVLQEGTKYCYRAEDSNKGEAEIYHFKSDTDLYVLKLNGRENSALDFEECVIRNQAESTR